MRSGLTRAVVLATAATVTVVGCGTTYPCPEPLDCTELASAREEAEAEFRRRLPFAEREQDRLFDVGGCSRELTLRAVDECGLDDCTEICRLHPCVEDGGPSCVTRCEELRDAFAPHLRAIVAAAGRTPGICTCDICPREAFAFCAELWGCFSG